MRGIVRILGNVIVTLFLAGDILCTHDEHLQRSEVEGGCSPLAQSRYGEFFVSLCVPTDRYSHLARNDDAYTYLSS